MGINLLLLSVVWIATAAGGIWRAANSQRVGQLLALLSWVTFGACLWVLDQQLEWALALHAKLWLITMGGVPYLLQKASNRIYGGLWVLLATAGILTGFGIYDAWMAFALGSLVLAAVLGLLRLTTIVSTLYSLAFILALLHLSERLWGEPLPLTTHLSLAGGWAAILQIGFNWLNKSGLITKAFPLGSWVLLFGLLSGFYPMTVLIDPGILHPVFVMLPTLLFSLGLLLNRGFRLQLAFFKALLVWGAFLSTLLLPAGQQELLYRATIMLFGVVLTQLLGLRRAGTRQRNVILIGSVLLILVYILGLQFRSLNIL